MFEWIDLTKAFVEADSSTGVDSLFKRVMIGSRSQRGLSTVLGRARCSFECGEEDLDRFVKEMETMGMVYIKEGFANILVQEDPVNRCGHMVIDINVQFAQRENGPKKVLFEIFGAPEAVATMKCKLETDYPYSHATICTVNRFDQRGVMHSRQITLSERDVETAHQAFYPWLSVALDDYFDAFMASKEPVLMLIGPPGTGKSTFIRSLIVRRQLDAWLAYNQGVVDNPALMDEFMSTQGADLLVYEDIDQHLGMREDGNTLMATLLNAVKGIGDFGKKKVIFSTNLPDINRVDSALVRIGRCFDILEHRLLNQEEAKAACKAAGMGDRDFSEKSEWSLAEILSEENFARQTTNRFARRTGFY